MKEVVIDVSLRNGRMLWTLIKSSIQLVWKT
jgi:hypothetical protein